MAASVTAWAASTRSLVAERRTSRPKRDAGTQRVEGAAIADIEIERAQPRHLHRRIEGEGEGRHAFEADGAVGGDEGFHQAAGALDGDAGLSRLPRHDAPIHRPAAERDHRMAAHGGIALVMDEQHGEIGARQIGLDRQHAIHVEMPARLEHQQPAQMIQMLAGMAPLGEDGGPRDRRITRGDEADRLAARVHLDGFDLEAHRGVPCLALVLTPARRC